jgi:hypothetical protein
MKSHVKVQGLKPDQASFKRYGSTGRIQIVLFMYRVHYGQTVTQPPAVYSTRTGAAAPGKCTKAFATLGPCLLVDAAEGTFRTSG